MTKFCRNWPAGFKGDVAYVKGLWTADDDGRSMMAIYTCRSSDDLKYALSSIVKSKAVEIPVTFLDRMYPHLNGN